MGGRNPSTLTPLIREDLLSCRLLGDKNEIPWRLSPEPFAITPEQFEFFTALGEDLRLFYRAIDELYLQSACRKWPPWVQDYLSMRIDAPIRDLGASAMFRGQGVRVIRPDVLLTKDGMAITELDSVPGGIGWTGALNQAYEKAGFSVVGDGGAMERNFAAFLGEVAGKDAARWAIVVSEESKDYWDEMVWLGKRLRALGFDGEVLGPEDIRLSGSRIVGKSARPIDVMYRFFELFDYRSIPNWDLLVHGLKKGAFRMTPPMKSYLEEKLSFALFHHPCLEDFWRRQLGAASLARLKAIFPRTWILDPRPLPPHAIIPDVVVGGLPIQRWEELYTLSQRQRRLVIKPSGYSPLAWGARGVVIGHDQSQARWAQAVEAALENFERTPCVLQEYRDPRRVRVRVEMRISEEEGRVRLCPYYMIVGGKAMLSGILATICPLDKKVIHGMRSAVMAPCMVCYEH
jgi:hypothetical protein